MLSLPKPIQIPQLYWDRLTRYCLTGEGSDLPPKIVDLIGEYDDGTSFCDDIGYDPESAVSKPQISLVDFSVKVLGIKNREQDHAMSICKIAGCYPFFFKEMEQYLAKKNPELGPTVILDGAKFSRVSLSSDIFFRHASARSTFFFNSVIAGRFDWADFTGSDFSYTTIKSTSLFQTNFQGAIFNRTKIYVDCPIRRLNFSGAKLIDITLVFTAQGYQKVRDDLELLGEIPYDFMFTDDASFEAALIRYLTPASGYLEPYPFWYRAGGANDDESANLAQHIPEQHSLQQRVHQALTSTNKKPAGQPLQFNYGDNPGLTVRVRNQSAQIGLKRAYRARSSDQASRPTPPQPYLDCCSIL